MPKPTTKTEAEEAEEIMDANEAANDSEDDFLSRLVDEEDEGEGDDEPAQGKRGDRDDDDQDRKPRGKSDAAKGAKDDDDEERDPFDVYDEEIPEGDEPEGDGDEEEESSDDEEGTAAESAVKALELDGWTEDQIKALPKKILLEVGAKRAAAHAKADRAAAGRGDNQAQGKQNDAAARKASTEKLVSKLSGMMAVPEPQAKAALQELVDTLTAPFAELRTTMMRVEASQARGRLQEKFPQLKVPKEFAATFSEAQRLMERDGEKFSTVAHALHAAAKLRYADDLIDGESQKDQDERRARRAGSPSNTSRKNTGERRETRDELETRWLKAGFDGNKAEQKRIDDRLGRRRR